MLNLKKFLTLGVTLASMCVANATSLYGQCACVEPVSDISFSLGWRRDELKSSTRDKHHDHSDVSDSKGSKEQGKNHFNAKDLNTWEIGVQLHAQMPEWCDCGCDGSNWWLRQLFVRGYAYRGWITDGKLHHRRNNVSGSDRNTVHDGKTIDGTIGLGFLWPVCDGFGIGPVGGYAYDEIEVKAKRHRKHDQSSESCGSNSSQLVASEIVVVDKASEVAIAEAAAVETVAGKAVSFNKSSSGSSHSHEKHKGIRYTQKWRGPWLGVDGVYNWCWCDNQVQINFGYEYHWAELRATTHANDVEQRHTSKNVWGNVFYIDSRYNVCDCWDLILGFDYKNFQTKKSKGHDNKWDHFGLTLDVAYRF